MNYLKNNWTVCFFSIVLLFLTYLYFMLNEMDSDSSASKIHIDNNEASLLISYNKRIKYLEKENALLHERAVSCRRQETQAIDDLSKELLDVKTNNYSYSDFEQYHQMMSSSQEFIKYIELLNGASSKDFSQDLAEKFSAEDVDFEWAVDYERKLMEIFSTSKELSYFVPENIQCKTKQCQIKISIADIEEANKLTENISNVLNENVLGINKSALISAPDFASGSVSFYITKSNDIRIHQ